MCERGKDFLDISCQYAAERKVYSEKIILASVDNYQIIEEYPDDKYFPSYLVCSEYGGYVFHILFAADVGGEGVRIVRAYCPNQDDWEDDLKTRRKGK